MTTLAVLLGLATHGSAARGQAIDPADGIDPAVDYVSLARYGPWDDRNYLLDREDLELLAPEEEEFAESEAIPAFFRVELRRAYSLATNGPVMYPRSGLPEFFNRHRGYLVAGRFYRSAVRRGDRWQVDLDSAEGHGGGRGSSPPDGEARITNPNDAAESAIAVNPIDTNLMIAGTNGPGFGQSMHYSSDGGVSWTSAGELPGSCCDPTVAWSSDGTIAYTSTLQFPQLFFYRSFDAGESWQGPIQVDDGGAFVDKQYLHVDRSPTSPYLDYLYHTWHENLIMRFSRSTDLGLTWSPPVTVSGAGQKGIGSDITSDAAGNLYYLWPAIAPRKIFVRKSVDGGGTFEPAVQVATTRDGFDFPIPVMETRRVFIYVSADADRTGGAFDGRIYAAWTDATAAEGTTSENHARIQVARSADGGATWDVSTPHDTADEETVDRFHPWLSVAGDGSVHVIFYDTRRDLPGRNRVDIFHAVSTDGGTSWGTAQRVTTEQSPNIDDGFEWGDYNGLDAVGARLVASFTDNRDEEGAGAESVDVYAARMRSTSIFSDGFESGDTSAWTSAVP